MFLLVFSQKAVIRCTKPCTKRSLLELARGQRWHRILSCSIQSPTIRRPYRRKEIMTRTSAILLAAVLLAGCDKPISEHWPEHTVTEAQRKLADDTVAEYKKAGIDAAARVQSYSAVGDFLNYGKTVNHRPSDTLKLDDQGVPMIFQAGRFFYSPGTVAIAALAEHGRYTVSKDPAKFFIMANKLLSMMGSDGALRYPYPYRHYTSIQSLAPGWTSGMDQGMALSVFARAYDVSKDKKWIKAGEKALKFMQTPFPLGPRSNLADLDPSLKGKLFYLEYYTAPNSYTLNGYMFALLGLYDWSTVAGSRPQRGWRSASRCGCRRCRMPITNRRRRARASARPTPR